MLVEAQAGVLALTLAGPCPLRAFRTASVVTSSTPAMQLAAATSLLSGAAGVEDKVVDGDVPRWARRPAVKVASRLAARGVEAADRCGLDPHIFARANSDAASVERPGVTLAEILRPTGDAVAAIFAHTATVSGFPENQAALAAVGSAFGRLVHLLDAVEDLDGDRKHGRFNPLTVTGTSLSGARAEADSLHASLIEALGSVVMHDPALVDALLGPALRSGINRVLPPPQPSPVQLRFSGRHTNAAPSRSGAAVGIAVAIVGQAAMFGGRRRGGYYGDPYGGGRGYGRRGCGPSCGEMLACDCCANLACGDCGGDGDCCCCCV